MRGGAAGLSNRSTSREIDPLVAPVRRRRKRRGHVHSRVAHAQAFDLALARSKTCRTPPSNTEPGMGELCIRLWTESDNAREHR